MSFSRMSDVSTWCLRLDNDKVADLNLDKLFVRTAEGIQIPVSEVATIELVNGPLQINRDATKRRIVIGVKCP